MSFEMVRQPIIPAKPAGLSTEELRRYLGVGRNAVSGIAQRFGIEKVHGLYPEPVVWRQLFGFAPDDDAARALLREPLTDINWVAWLTGHPHSTISAALREDRWRYDCGVQLGEAAGTMHPRSRRWLPCLLRAQITGAATASFRLVEPFSTTNLTDQPSAPSIAEATEPGVFSVLFEAAATTSPDRPE